MQLRRRGPIHWRDVAAEIVNKKFEIPDFTLRFLLSFVIHLDDEFTLQAKKI